MTNDNGKNGKRKTYKRYIERLERIMIKEMTCIERRTWGDVVVWGINKPSSQPTVWRQLPLPGTFILCVFFPD